jgi:hypothetical protein
MNHKNKSKNERVYRIRFHLAKGEHFMHWQVRHKKTKKVVYYDPNEMSIEMLNCKLGNQPSTANKIFEGANKSVCAWVDCEDYKLFPLDVAEKVIEYFSNAGELENYMYNPRKNPHWYTTLDDNVDNRLVNRIVTLNNKIYG